MSRRLVIAALVFLAGCPKPPSGAPEAGSAPTASAPSPTPGAPVSTTPWIKDDAKTLCPISAGTTTDERPGVNPKVTNGTAYDSYGFTFGGVSALQVPPGATVIEDAPAGTILIDAKKHLNFKGHPPLPMSPETARQNLGLAWQAQGEVLALGSIGEWSNKEGRAWIELRIHVPKGLAVREQATHGGPESIASTRERPDADSNYWYSGREAAPGWTALVAVPNPGAR